MLEENLLDDDEVKGRLFGDRAFWYFRSCLFLLGLSLLATLLDILTVGYEFNVVSLVGTGVTLVISIMGLVNAVKSSRRGEDHPRQQLALTGNSIAGLVSLLGLVAMFFLL